MERLTEDFIRDECEWEAFEEKFTDGPDEDEVIAECENCGADIYVYDNPLGMVVRDGDTYRTMYLCKDCAKQMRVTDILTLLDIMYYEPVFDGEGDKVIEKTSGFCRRMNAIVKAEQRERIAFAAQIASGKAART